MLTSLEPVLKPTLGSEKPYLYVRYGDPLFVELCEEGVQEALGLRLQPLETRRIELNVGFVGD